MNQMERHMSKLFPFILALVMSSTNGDRASLSRSIPVSFRIHIVMCTCVFVCTIYCNPEKIEVGQLLLKMWIITMIHRFSCFFPSLSTSLSLLFNYYVCVYIYIYTHILNIHILIIITFVFMYLYIYMEMLDSTHLPSFWLRPGSWEASRPRVRVWQRSCRSCSRAWRPRRLRPSWVSWVPGTWGRGLKM